MTPEEALAALLELEHEYDMYGGHMKADDILCDLLRVLGHHDVVEAYDRIPRWYHGDKLGNNQERR